MPDAVPAAAPVAPSNAPTPADPQGGPAGSPAGLPVPPASESPSVPADGASPATPGAVDTAVDEPKFAKQFAALAKREADAARREKEFSDREKKAAALEEKLARFKVSPHELLAETGLTMQQLLDSVLNEGKPLSAEQRVEALEKERAAEKAARAEAEKQASAAKTRDVVEGFNRGVTERVKAAGDAYELVNARNAYAVVHSVIEEHFLQTSAAGQPELLTAEQAAQLVEDHLTREADSYLATKKVKAKVGAKPEDAKPVADAQGEETKEKKIVAELKAKRSVQKPRITNAATAAPKSDAAPPKNESKSERIERILAKVRASAG